jgi:proteasome assembly chaperone (PAC2) family protein
MSEDLVILFHPNLDSPSLVAGFGGWPNAGEVSSWVISFLIESLGAAKFAEIKPEPFFDLIQQRPLVTIKEGTIKSVKFPCGAFYSVPPLGGHRNHVILFLGQEPHLHWSRFSEAFFDLCAKVGVKEMITVGGLYDNIPHTVDPTVSLITNDLAVVDRFGGKRLRLATYEGPMSIHTHLLVEAGKRGIPAMSLWGHVPYYIQSNNAKTCLSLLDRLRTFLQLDLDLREVQRASELLDQEVERIVKDKPELRQYIEALEREFLEEEGSPPSKRKSLKTLPQAGEKVIRIDPFLRKG